jgi:hypothetical protein
MGTKFFAQKPSSFSPSNLNMEGRSISAGSYAGRAAAGSANKDIAQAVSLYKTHAFKPQARGAAYPPGPKKV